MEYKLALSWLVSLGYTAVPARLGYIAVPAVPNEGSLAEAKHACNRNQHVMLNDRHEQFSVSGT